MPPPPQDRSGLPKFAIVIDLSNSCNHKLFRGPYMYASLSSFTAFRRTRDASQPVFDKRRSLFPTLHMQPFCVTNIQHGLAKVGDACLWA